jgi:hypothetical protein
VIYHLQNALVFGISLLSLSSFASYDCRDYVSEDSYSYFKEVCNDQGELIEKIEFFKEGDKVYAQTWFSNNLPVKKKNYSSKGGFNLRTYSYNVGKLTLTSFQKNRNLSLPKKLLA